MNYSYIDAISEGFPDIQAYCLGDDFNYNSIVAVNGVLPTKEELDIWINERIRQRYWELIKEERDRRRSRGGFKVGEYWFHSDNTSRIQQLGLLMYGINMPTGIMWKTMSGELVEMTPSLAQQILQSAGSSDTVLFSYAEQKKVELYNATDLENFEYLTGWPIIYGEE